MLFRHSLEWCTRSRGVESVCTNSVNAYLQTVAQPADLIALKAIQSFLTVLLIAFVYRFYMAKSELLNLFLHLEKNINLVSQKYFPLHHRWPLVLELLLVCIHAPPGVTTVLSL